MSENRQPELLESLSALADGEATEMELRRILKDEENGTLLSEKWRDYQRISSALNTESTTGVDISAAVMQAVEQEAGPSFVSRFSKPFGQVAVAASVAVFALFGVQQYQIAQLDDPSLGAGSVAEVEPSAVSDPVDFTPPRGFEVLPQTSLVSTNPELGAPVDVSQLEVRSDQRAMYQHLNEAISEHSENASEATQEIYPMLRAPTEN